MAQNPAKTYEREQIMLAPVARTLADASSTVVGINERVNIIDSTLGVGETATLVLPSVDEANGLTFSFLCQGAGDLTVSDATGRKAFSKTTTVADNHIVCSSNGEFWYSVSELLA